MTSSSTVCVGWGGRGRGHTLLPLPEGTGKCHGSCVAPCGLSRLVGGCRVQDCTARHWPHRFEGELQRAIAMCAIASSSRSVRHSWHPSCTGRRQISRLRRLQAAALPWLDYAAVLHATFVVTASKVKRSICASTESTIPPPHTHTHPPTHTPLISFAAAGTAALPAYAAAVSAVQGRIEKKTSSSWLHHICDAHRRTLRITPWGDLGHTFR